MNTCRPSGGKDRHLKVKTSKGPRDRRIRLSVSAAIQLYDIQDRLGYNQPSKAVEWLIRNAQHAISELKSLPFIAERELATESEKYSSIAEPSREALVDDELPISKPLLDLYSSAGGLVLSKESYEYSPFVESALRTFHHVSNARRLDFDDQTRTRDEESASAESLERRYSESMPVPGCNMLEAFEEKDARCLTVKMDSRSQARERAKERAKVKSLLRTTGQNHITNNRSYMPSEIALQSFLTDNKASSDPSFRSSQIAQYPIVPAQVTRDPSLISIPFLKHNTASKMSHEFSHRFAPPSQPQNVNEMLSQSSVNTTRLQLRPTANEILLASLQPVSSSTSRINLHEAPFSLSYVAAPAIYQYLSATAGHPLFHAVAMSQLSALGFSNYSQQEDFCHSQVYRPPEFATASMIHPNAPTNILHRNSTHSSWQGWPQTLGQLLSTDSATTSSARALLSEDIRPKDPDPAVQYFSDMARSLSPPPTASFNKQDFIPSGRGTFRSLVEGSETIEGVFNSEERSQSSV